MINGHFHIFRDIDVGNKFIFILVPIARTKVGFFILKNIMKLIDPFFKNTSFQRLIRMIDVGRMESQEKIFLNGAKHYPNDTQFIVITIDMENMGAGKVPRPYYNQLEEIEELYYKYPDKIIIFPHIDPRRSNFMDIVKKPYVQGIKLYPPMGYSLHDKRLTKLYEYCNKKGLPIIIHCGEDSPCHWKGKKKYIIDLLKKYKIPHNPRHSKRKLSAQFCHPQQIFPLAAKYQNINWKLAHWGSHSAWKNYIKDPLDQNNWFVLIKRGMKVFKNIYADISFVMYEDEFFPILKIEMEDEEVGSKVTFGSDYYMVKFVKSEWKFYTHLRGYLGKELWEKMAIENERKYLKIS